MDMPARKPRSRLRPSRFVQFLVQEGLLSLEEATEVTDASRNANALLGQMMLKRKLLTLKEMVALLAKQASSPSKRLGEIAIDSGLIDRTLLEELLAEQPHAGAQHPLDALRIRGSMPCEVLNEAMAAYIKMLEDAESC